MVDIPNHDNSKLLALPAKYLYSNSQRDEFKIKQDEMSLTYM